MKEDNVRFEIYSNDSASIPFTLVYDIFRTEKIKSNMPNWHENIEIEFFNKGEGFVLLDGKKIKVKSGEIAVISPNVVHYTYTETELNYDCIIVNNLFLADAEIKVDKTVFQSCIKDENISCIFNKLKSIYLSDDCVKVAKCRALTLDIFVKLCESHISNDVNFKSNIKTTDVKAAMSYIHENFDKKLTLDSVAKNVHKDKYNLSHDFKRYTGYTIFQYINHYRIVMAAEYIRKGLTVSEAAEKCAYNNMSFFAKQFLKHIHILPSKFKTSIKE